MCLFAQFQVFIQESGVDPNFLSFNATKMGLQRFTNLK